MISEQGSYRPKIVFENPKKLEEAANSEREFGSLFSKTLTNLNLLVPLPPRAKVSQRKVTQLLS